MRARTLAARAAAAAAVVGLVGVLGCGPRGPRTYPVQGKVELAAGDVTQLAGNQVEAALESDPTVRASGVIQPDGSFTLETLHRGVIRKGAPEGSYQARIVLSDDDRASLPRSAQALHPRFLRFKTAGLSFQVPADGDVTLKLSKR